jgi:hypothetical protein
VNDYGTTSHLSITDMELLQPCCSRTGPRGRCPGPHLPACTPVQRRVSSPVQRRVSSPVQRRVSSSVQRRVSSSVQRRVSSSVLVSSVQRRVRTQYLPVRKTWQSPFVDSESYRLVDIGCHRLVDSGCHRLVSPESSHIVLVALHLPSWKAS